MAITDGGNRQELVFGDTKYVHRVDHEYDYLIDDSGNKVKVNLRFAKSKEKNEYAKKALKAFFRDSWS